MTYILITLSFYAIALLLAYWLCRRIFKGRIHSISVLLGRLCFSVLLIIIVVSSILIGQDLSSYRGLSNTEHLGYIHFKQLGPQEYQAVLDLNEKERRHYRLLGDQWQLDTRLITWKWARFGFTPGYRLERISGRYQDINQANKAERTVYAIETSTSLVDVWQWVKQYKLSFVDAAYGNAVFLPMAEDAMFTITLSANGLVAVPANTAAERAMSQWP